MEAHLLEVLELGPMRHKLSYWDAPALDLEVLTRRYGATVLETRSFHKGIDYRVEQLWRCGALLYELHWFSEDGMITLSAYGHEESVPFDAPFAELGESVHEAWGEEALSHMERAREDEARILDAWAEYADEF